MHKIAIVFDGAGTKWVPAFEDASHERHELWMQVKGSVEGACSFCSAAFGARSGVQAAGVTLLDDYEQHPSLRGYVARGFTILTF